MVLAYPTVALIDATGWCTCNSAQALSNPKVDRPTQSATKRSRAPGLVQAEQQLSTSARRIAAFGCEGMSVP